MKRTVLGFVLISILAVACSGSATTEGENAIVEDAIGENAIVEVEPVSVWVSDSECMTFEERTVELPTDYTAQTLVEVVIAESWSQQSLEIESIDVTVDPSTATADVALFHPADSVRSFGSLASCELHVLFGGITETLVRSETLNVETVRFGGQAEF